MCWASPLAIHYAVVIIRISNIRWFHKSVLTTGDGALLREFTYSYDILYPEPGIVSKPVLLLF